MKTPMIDSVKEQLAALYQEIHDIFPPSMPAIRVAGETILHYLRDVEDMNLQMHIRCEFDQYALYLVNSYVEPKTSEDKE